MRTASTATQAPLPAARPSSPHAQRRFIASALPRESTRVSRTVGSQLQLLVSSSSRALPSSGPILLLSEGDNGTFSPALKLELGALLDANGQWSAHVRVAGGPTRALKEALQALALVLSHSQLLNGYPERKVQFWCSVLGGFDAITADYGGQQEWILGDPRFPSRVELGFKRASAAPLSSKVTDAIYEFLKTPPKPSPSEYIRALAKKMPLSQVGIGLSFASTNMALEGLQLVAELLERVFARPGRQFAVEMLDLSHNEMNGAMLTMTTEIFKKNAVYQIKNIRLDSIATELELLKNGQIDHLLKLIQVVLEQRVETQSHEHGLHGKMVPGMRSLSLAGNRLGTGHFAAICSAMRYGCIFDALSLASTLAQVDPRERQQCWKWLAFGVFTRRSKRFDYHDRLRNIDLSSCTLDQVAIDSMRATFSNPVAELRQIPDNECETAVLLCCFKPGTRVYFSRDTTSATVLVLSQQRELEVLYSPRYDDDWRCVVVPGSGLGWAERRYLRTIVDELYLQREVGLRYNLVIRDLPRTSCLFSSLSDLLACIGSQLRSLDLGNAHGDHLPYQAILDHCSHLEHLGLDGVKSTSEFLQLMCGSSFGHNLLSLNLSRVDPGSSVFYLVVLMMAEKQKLSKLRELRMSQFSVDDKELAWLHDVLRTNHSLLMLELDAPSDRDEDEERREQRDRLDADYNNRVVVVPLPTRCKIALASVLNNPKSRVQVVGFLDMPLLMLIFEFAAEKATRRIIWRTA